MNFLIINTRIHKGKRDSLKNRFEIVYRQRLGGRLDDRVRVLIDKATGVNYLMIKTFEGGTAITPLLDKNGNPIVNKS